MQETDAEVPDVRLDQLSSEMAKVVTLASGTDYYNILAQYFMFYIACTIGFCF